MKKILVLTILAVFPGIVGAATLSVSPSSQNVNVGDTFSVTVRLDTQGKGIDGVDLKYLNYNPSLLQATKLTPGGLMPSTLLNKIDSALGKISFSQLAAGGSKYTGSGTLATITFKALAPGTSQITFDHTPSNTTDSNVAAAGADVLTAVINGSLTIKGQGSVIPKIPESIKSRYTPQEKSNTEAGPFVPLPAGSEEEEELSDSSRGTLSDIIKYIVLRIKNGFLRIFGK